MAGFNISLIHYVTPGVPAMIEPTKFMTYRKIVKPEDLNAANTLFGGRLMSWLDDAAAMYAMCQMNTQRIVTLKVSELLFKNPAKQGDILEFNCSVVKTGTSSFTLSCDVITKSIPVPVRLNEEKSILGKIIASCEMVFVAVDAHGKATPWGRG